jgi:aspartyl-tRNA(Asn)/glutamyl-tRNA(Gln) amidotransferase subunit C
MSEHKISLEEVKRVAKLARLALPDEEAQKMQAQMDAILGYMAELDALDVRDVVPTFHAAPMDAPLRPDVVARSLPTDEALAAAPEAEAGGFAVPKVLEVGE